MTVKIFKGVWFFSMLGLLAIFFYIYAGLPIFFYIYAGLPETVMLWDFPEQTTISRSGLFYSFISTIAILNATVYLVRQISAKEGWYARFQRKKVDLLPGFTE